MLLLVPSMVLGLLACVWVLTRSRWSWWVRIPGCVVVYPVAAYVGTVVFLGLGIVIAWVVVGIKWVIAIWPPWSS